MAVPSSESRQQSRDQGTAIEAKARALRAKQKGRPEAAFGVFLPRRDAMRSIASQNRARIEGSI
jgi:hypothetical protein